MTLLLNWPNLTMGLLFMALGVPLILGKVPPNPYYGFRTRKTLASPEVWYPINRLMGRDLVAVGALVALTAVAFALTGARYSFEQVMLVNLGTLVVGLAAAVAHGAIALRKM